MNLPKRRPAAAAAPIADPLAEAQRLAAESRLIELHEELTNRLARHPVLRQKLLDVTAEETRARRRSDQMNVGDVSQLAAFFEAERSASAIRDDLAAITAELRENGQAIVDLNLAIKAATDEQGPAIRETLSDGYADLAGDLMVTLTHLAEQYRTLTHYQRDSEALVDRTRLRPLGTEMPLPGVRTRLLGDSQAQEGWFITLCAEWLEQGRLRGGPADVIRAFVRDERARLERSRQELAEHRVKAEREARENERLWKRERLLSGEIQRRRGLRVMSPAEAVGWFDFETGHGPMPKVKQPVDDELVA